MIARTYGIGTFPDVCWHDGAWWIASHEGSSLCVRCIDTSGRTSSESHIDLQTSEGLAFPRLASYAGSLWLAYRESTASDRAILLRVGGESRCLTPAGGNHPAALGHGYVAWQDKASGRVLRLRLDNLDGGGQDAGPVCAVGLSRILPDGRVVTMDEDMTAVCGTTRPSWAGSYAVAEHPTGGLYLLSTASLDGLIWASDRLCKTPRMDVSPSGQIAAVTWGDYQPIALYLVEPSELTPAGAIIHADGSVPFNVIPYLLGDLSTYPHQTAAGETWDLVTDPPRKLMTHTLGGMWRQVWRYDDTMIYLYWDDWGQEPTPTDKKAGWGYTFREGAWLRRMMRVGDSIDGSRNRIHWHDRRTGEPHDTHGLPYANTLVARYAAYPCGRLGMRPAIEWHYAIGDVYRERNIHVEGWGLYQWNAQGLVNGEWVNLTDGQPIDRTASSYVRVNLGPPPLPTTIYPVWAKPPKLAITGAYPRTITGHGHEPLAEWRDDDNPDTGGAVWLDNGSLHIRITNTLGADQSGLQRDILIRKD